MGNVRDLISGACCAWPLPGDASCAATARVRYREAAAEVGIGADVAYDGITMASELAANTLHAVTAGPAWAGGRGLQVVHELSGGRWGHHLTRARLGRWKVRGKAVWFALPAPVPAAPSPAGDGGATRDGGDGGLATVRRCRQLSARQATEKLQDMLSARGLGGRLLRADQPAADMSVLWVSRGLTVSCRDGSVLIETPAGDRQHWTYADLVDVSERAVWMHEELERG
jgi:hypothetical protein